LCRGAAELIPAKDFCNVSAQGTWHNIRQRCLLDSDEWSNIVACGRDDSENASHDGDVILLAQRKRKTRDDFEEGADGKRLSAPKLIGMGRETQSDAKISRKYGCEFGKKRQTWEWALLSNSLACPYIYVCIVIEHLYVMLSRVHHTRSWEAKYGMLFCVSYHEQCDAHSSLQKWPLSAVPSYSNDIRTHSHGDMYCMCSSTECRVAVWLCEYRVITIYL